MRVVTIAARDAGDEHLALAERRVVKDLIEALAVSFEQTRLQQARQVRVQQRAPRPPRLGDLGAAGMAHPAGLQFLRRRARRRATGTAGGGIDHPVNAVALVELHRQAVRTPFGSLRPGNVRRARAVAGFAGDVDLGPGRRVGVAGGVVALAQLGRVTFGALEVPGLIDAGPVQWIARMHILVGIKVEPALTTLVLRPAVPGDAESLHPAVGKGDQVLLQRVDAEDVADLEVAELAIRIVGVDEEFAAASEEPRGDAASGKRGAAKIAEHIGLARLLHGEVVMGSAPSRCFRFMAAGTGGTTDECGASFHALCRFRPGRGTTPWLR